MRKLTSRDILIWLNSINISNGTIDLLIKKFDDLSNLWYIPSECILKLDKIRYKTKKHIIACRKYNYIENILSNIDKNNVNVVTIFDDTYPESLRNIYGSPKVLYYKGEFSNKDHLAIAIVGSRKSTSYGKWASEKIARELSKLGITIVSGMANGIDSVAHEGALKENGRTIAVLGSGIDIIYPSRNKELYKSICESGVVVSEFPLGTKPFHYNFPQRNRIISGLSLGVVVVEATEKSGSLITAGFAAEQGKEVFALPGNINSLFSRGTNKLLKDGAKLVMDVDDIIEEIHELQEKLTEDNLEKIDFSNLSDIETEIVKCIREGPIHCDSIAYKTGLDISTVTSTLTILELKGFVEELSGKIYTLI